MANVTADVLLDALEGVSSCPVFQEPIDSGWMLTSAMRIITMQSGFALLESAFTRKNNQGSLMLKNTLDLVAGVFAYYYVGYGLAFGEVTQENSFAGGSPPEDWNNAFWFFQFSFASTATTINSGAIAERVNFWAYFILSLFTCGVSYPIVVHWCWGGGWLGERGFQDFAGGMVVHGFGGICALTACTLCGPRIGCFPQFRTWQGWRRKLCCEKRSDHFYRGPHGIEHLCFKPAQRTGNPVQMVFGMLMLWIAWYSFNAGSTTALTGQADNIASKTTVTTSMGAAGGALATLAINPWEWGKGKGSIAQRWHGRVVIPDLASCVIAGLVGITAGPHALEINAALVVGFLSGCSVFVTGMVLEKFQLDDVVGAFACHGVPGIFGTLMVGMLGGPDCEQDLPYGVLRGGDGETLVTQIIGILAIGAWAFGTTCGICGFLTIIGVPLRIERHKEVLGLDYTEHVDTLESDPNKMALLFDLVKWEEKLDKLLHHDMPPALDDPVWAMAEPQSAKEWMANRNDPMPSQDSTRIWMVRKSVE